MAPQTPPEAQVRLFIPFTPSIPDKNGFSPIMSDPKEKFFRHFQVEVTAIQDLIEDLGSLSPVGGERQGCMDAILTGISRLNNEVIDAGEYIPAYDQRTYSQAIKALTEKYNEASGKTKPKSRFQFKSRPAKTADDSDGTLVTGPRLRNPFDGSTNGSGDVPSSTMIQDAQSGDKEARAEVKDSLGQLPAFLKNYNEELAQASGRGVRKPSFSTAKNIAIHDHTGLHIMLPASASRATASGSLTSLQGCIVDMTIPTRRTISSSPTGSGSGVPFAGLALRDISKSLIVAGHVSGATHITGLRDSVVVVAARQVRIHECHNVDVYLHCTSHPIIEDCDGMRFAPLPDVYKSQEDGPNQWSLVDDFKWLKTEPSPNWSVLPEDKRVDSDRLSTTMEQELAQLRAVAGFVDNIVSLGETRVNRQPLLRQQQQQQQRRWRTPPSPTAAFHDYSSDEESLPAYDEGPHGPRFATDGFGYHHPGQGGGRHETADWASIPPPGRPQA